MYAQGHRSLVRAPTVDEREMWAGPACGHIAHEGRCFVVSACQVASLAETNSVWRFANWPADRPFDCRGQCDHRGRWATYWPGRLRGEAGLLTAEIDTEELIRARYDYDVCRALRGAPGRIRVECR